ncbi:MAG: ATP-binding cassette domain-containing protein [Brachybacterium sp.]|uniref:ABC transporter ATP-binding protein n=1 Tax=Brachybacterium sp. TaxID=1891286 RepID=UPI002647CDCF|nr:ATP-binding cassette domain-containing protein [Brachybacterium sp.]MDN5687577.1 ATP-binding cassette domain-containing protein [Brachybacterium sp.]
MGAILQIDDLCIKYGRNMIVTEATLEVGPGASASVVGRSGSGKSTILAAILGMVKATRGTITVDGVNVGSVRGAARRTYLRDTVSVIFQRGELIDELEPVENVAVAALLSGVSRAEAFDRATDLLAQVDVRASGTTTGVLSGGEYQRVAVARALVTRPQLVLADEPTGSLDVEYRDIIGDLVLSIPKTWGSALLLVTHDRTLAARADAQYVLAPQAEAGARLESQR